MPWLDGAVVASGRLAWAGTADFDWAGTAWRSNAFAIDGVCIYSPNINKIGISHILDFSWNFIGICLGVLLVKTDIL